MIPLSLASPGEVNTIGRITGKEDVKKFLENLGFVVGSDVTVISKNEGNVIVNIKDSRVAIGEDMARRIMLV